MASAETVAGVPETASAIEILALRGAIDRRLLDELWRASDGPSWELTRDEFDMITVDVGTASNFGLAAGAVATREQQPSSTWEH